MPRVKSLTRALGVPVAQPDEREEKGEDFKKLEDGTLDLNTSIVEG